MKISQKILIIIASLLICTANAHAVVTVLNFEGINKTYPSGYANVQDFYNGGTSSDGTSGTNYGVSFSANALAICLNTPGVTCSNTSRGGLGDPTSDKGALFFLEGTQTYMNLAQGFDTGFSFFYTAINYAGSISVYDGLNGTGNLLAHKDLPTTTSIYSNNAYFSPFFAEGIAFSGLAKSVSFAGVANQVVFDDVTFGSVTPNPKPTPEPSSLFLLGSGLSGLALLRRKLRA